MCIPVDKRAFDSVLVTSNYCQRLNLNALAAHKNERLLNNRMCSGRFFLLPAGPRVSLDWRALIPSFFAHKSVHRPLCGTASRSGFGASLNKPDAAPANRSTPLSNTLIPRQNRRGEPRVLGGRRGRPNGGAGGRSSAVLSQHRTRPRTFRETADRP